MPDPSDFHFLRPEWLLGVAEALARGLPAARHALHDLEGATRRPLLAPLNPTR